MFMLFAFLFFIVAAFGEHPVFKTLDYTNAGLAMMALHFLIGGVVWDTIRTHAARPAAA